TNPTGVFTPLVHVDVEATDVPVNPHDRFRVRGQTFLAKTLDDTGGVRRLVREGRHTVLDAHGTVVARARLLNVFTPYTTDPAGPRVTPPPPPLGLGDAPSRTTDLPTLDALLPRERRPDFVEDTTRVWHYGQTDANRHVNGMEYLRAMES